MGELVRTTMAGPLARMELENNLARAMRSAVGFHVHGNEAELLGQRIVVAKYDSAELDQGTCRQKPNKRRIAVNKIAPISYDLTPRSRTPYPCRLQPALRMCYW
jgi:hypothetical protein